MGRGDAGTMERDDPAPVPTRPQHAPVLLAHYPFSYIFCLCLLVPDILSGGYILFAWLVFAKKSLFFASY
jgi:hypothetical protein